MGVLPVMLVLALVFKLLLLVLLGPPLPLAIRWCFGLLLPRPKAVLSDNGPRTEWKPSLEA